MTARTPDPDIPDSGFALRHEIFILDANLLTALDQTHMKPITRTLIDALLHVLGLEELGPLELYPATDLRAPGWSFLQPITTSHISGHYFEKPGKAPHIHMDIYSCDAVEWQKIVGVVDEHLGLADWRASFIERKWGEEADERTYLDLSGIGAEVERIRVPKILAPRTAKLPRIPALVRA
jgi:hypothetical protein